MAKPVQKAQAIKLRKKGKSISQIAKELSVSKGSVSSWVKDVFLSKSAKNSLALRTSLGSYYGRVKGSLTNKNRSIEMKESIFQESLKELKKINNRDLLLLGIGLFWAEGNKNGSRFIFSNSNPEMISIMMSFLEICMDVSREDIYLSVQINESHKFRSNKVTLFWSNRLGINKNLILGPYFIKSKTIKHYHNSEEYYGIARLQVRRSSVLQYRILGYIRTLVESFKMSG